MSQHTLKLVEIAHLDFNLEVFTLLFQILASAVDSGLDAAGEVDMIVFQHYHIIQAYAMVGAAATSHCVFFQQPHIGRRLAGIEQARIEAVEHSDQTLRLGGNAAETLHKVERGALGRKNASGVTFDQHHNVALLHSVAVVLEQRDFQRRIHLVEHAFAHYGTTKYTILFGNHLGSAYCR